MIIEGLQATNDIIDDNQQAPGMMIGGITTPAIARMLPSCSLVGVRHMNPPRFELDRS